MVKKSQPSSQPSPQSPQPLPDASPGRLWRYTPSFLYPFVQLARLDRPVGVGLLFWPCVWSLMLATAYQRFALWGDAGMEAPGDISLSRVLWLGVLFLFGAVVMRGAGCTYNDIVDRKLDARVARTRHRPLACGRVSLLAAWLFLLLQGGLGLLVLLQLNDFSILLGISSLGLVALYPFMKRLVWWPQAFLGLTFNWGALLGWACITGFIHPSALTLYVGCFFWTLGYDTIYAHQDRQDDRRTGIKSLALYLGDATPRALVIFYSLAIVFFALSVWLVVMPWTDHRAALIFASLAGVGILFIAGLLAQQIYRFDASNPATCLKLFRANNAVGMGMFFFLLAGVVALEL